jgi:hypothetical protein
MNRDHVVALIAGMLRANGQGDVLECVQDAEGIVTCAEWRGTDQRERGRAARRAAEEAPPPPPPPLPPPPSPYPPPVPNGFKDWPSIEFPDWLRSLGFEDRSYHNDACGRAEFPLSPDANEQGFPKLQCWVEHEEVAQREHGGPRFELDVILKQDDEGDLLYQGDDPDACEAAFWVWWDEHADEFPGTAMPTRGPKE